MCGIVGYIRLDHSTKPLSKEVLTDVRGVFDRLLHYSQFRGIDGTGLMKFEYGKPFTTLKQATYADYFLQIKEYKKYLEDFSGIKYLVGHTRSATKERANIKTKHTHPFIYKNIALVHNGTITNHAMLESKTQKFDIDSEAIAHFLADNGVESLVNKIHKDSYALVWFDGNEQTINFIRNIDRPLVFGTIVDQPLLLFASEGDFIEAACLESELLKVESLHNLPIHTHLKINSETNLVETTKIEVPVDKTYYQGGHNWVRGFHNGTADSYWELEPIPMLPPPATAKKIPANKNLASKIGKLLSFKAYEFSLYKNQRTNTKQRGNMMCLQVANWDGELVVVTNTTAAYFNEAVDKDYVLRGRVVSVQEGQIDKLLVNFKDISSCATQSSNKDTKKIIVPGLFRGPDDTYISKEELDEILKLGCFGCGRDLNFSDYFKVVWVGAGSALCEKCGTEERFELTITGYPSLLAIE